MISQLIFLQKLFKFLEQVLLERSRMKENKEYLHERIKHFQSLIDYMSERGQRYYLEKDWFDNPTLISIEEAKKEVEQAQKKLELLPE